MKKAVLINDIVDVVYASGVPAPEDAVEVPDNVFPGFVRDVDGSFGPPPSDASIADLIAYAADRKWRAEIGGTVWNAWPVATDRDSQAKVIAERLAIEAGERADPDGWKFADGVFRPVSNADFIALSNAVRNHVRACFAVEAQLQAAIAAETVTTFAEIDAADWP